MLLITTLALAAPTQLANTIVVNPGQSIQAAINAANPGDTVMINPGTYTESLTLNKAVNLTGVNSATVILKAPANQRVLAMSGAVVNDSVIISGFTVANGNVTGGNTCPTYCGGGIMITGTAQPQLWNLIIINNRAGKLGGGLYADGPLTLTHTNFISNTTQDDGGGAYIRGAAIVNNSRFERNSGANSPNDTVGGGLMAGNTLIINDSQFISNTIVGGTYGGLGAGVYAGRAVTITDSVFDGNQCTGSFCTGGGLYAYTTLTANRSTFMENAATNGGGGVYAVTSAALFNARFEDNVGNGLDSGGVVTATDSVFLGNQNNGLSTKSAILVRGRFENSQDNDIVVQTLALTGTWFSGNSAGRAVYLNNFSTPSTSRIVNALFTGSRTAVYMDSPSSNLTILQSTIAVENLNPSTAIVAQQGTIGITDTIVASQTLGVEQGSGVVYEDYNLFFGNTTNLSGTIGGGTHDVFGDPNFANPALDSYHIISPSAAIDAGINAGVTADLDNIPRPIGAGFDIGAYEYINFTSHVYLPLIRR